MQMGRPSGHAGVTASSDRLPLQDILTNADEYASKHQVTIQGKRPIQVVD
jgi:hypothetical protein